MNRFLDSLARLSIGALADIGLACLVLAVFAGFVWSAVFMPLLAGAAAAWLLAAAVFAARRMAGRSEGERRVAASALAAFALLLALVAAASAGRGIVPSSPRAGAGATEDVAGATATPDTTAPATSSPDAAASTEAPSPESSASPSGGPLADASPTPHRGPVQVNSVNVTSPVARGGTATVTVSTTPWTQCSIRVSYRGASGTPGLDPTVSDGSGAASWTWTIDPGVRTGTWPVRVTCRSGGYSAWDTVTLRVR